MQRFFDVSTLIAVLLGILILHFIPRNSQAEVLKVVSRNDANANYAIGLLRLGLSKVDTKYDISVSDGLLSSERLKRNAESGEIDVIWAATNLEMETAFLPVRVPLYKGLLGFRVLLIHSDNVGLFSGVSNKESLKQFKFGQGRGWPDTDILAANGLNVISATKYESLFHMTDGKRFHAFPRGINEPWEEIRQRPELELSVDSHLLLVYRMPYYLFVTPKKAELAKNIETGLLAAIEDKSFDQFFFSSHTVQDVMEKVDFSQRKIIELDNPQLPPETPINNSNLWISLDQLQRNNQASY